jgi:hypothetical protein
MVELVTPHDYVILFALAALFGAIGGVAYELVQNRPGGTGILSLPSLTPRKFVDLGFVSSMLLGAVAAVAVSYFFTPEVQVTKVVNGMTTVVTEWQIVKVLPLSLIIGSGGGAFLDAMRSRVLSEVNAQKVTATQAAGKAAVAQVAQVAKAAAAGQATGTAGKIVSGGVGEIAEAASEVPSKVRVGLLQLAPDQHDQGRITEFLGALTDPTPLAERADRLSAGVQAALDDATQRTAELIDESAKSAFETIDAAATATATRP